MPHHTDPEMSRLVGKELSAGLVSVLVAANGYQARLFGRRDAVSPWAEIGTGDLDEETANALSPVARAGSLFWVDVVGTLSSFAPTAQVAAAATMNAVNAWRKRRDKATGTAGRQGEVSASTQREVEALAAWRCQFDGCGEDLREHGTSVKHANYGYLAHIIASSADGPRGDSTLSGTLANDASNIMLLCDKCHRLIDRVDPALYDVNRLREMRDRNICEVKRLLNALSYPTAHMVVVGGYIEGQNAGFNQRAAEEAMWGRRLRSATAESFWFLRNGGNLPDSTHDQYWGGLFQTLNTEIASMQSYLNGTSRGGPACTAVALFPTHVTSIQILAGRLIGNSTTVHLFQPNRNAPAGTRGERWAWPPGAPDPAADKYQLKTLVEHSGQDEGALLVYLTASVDESELPPAIAATMPMMELRAQQPNHAVIAAQKDLDALAVHMDNALRRLQDEWRVHRVHLVVVAPASACVLLGQKLQARHHANVVLYERKRVPPGQGRGPFVPTIEIGQSEVQLVGTIHRVPLG
jgi:hypothetical protein